jgi:hypothetical protein
MKFFLVGQPKDLDPLCFSDQSLERNFVECVLLENEMGRRAEWTEKLRQKEVNE